ncbi:hypothetical protein CY35_14G003600 [Sphagnum magellanicum]|nr:hypothetical protein CY35_14G003600 [Sphagnum magellanicum]
MEIMQGAAASRALPELNHLLQHTLRSLCTDSQWVYAVFWRILPRNYPPPQWESESEAMNRSKGNKRNWIMLWEDGFCNFSACAGAAAAGQEVTAARTSADDAQPTMNPDLFFKMSHEVYNYGEGEPLEEDQSSSSFLSPWAISSLDPHPRPWEAQFKAGIQTIAVVAVEEGVVQLGSTEKIMKDLNFAAQLQRKFSYFRSIPGVFVPHFLFNASNNSSKNDRMSFGHEQHQGSSLLSAESERGQWMIRGPEHDHHQLLRGSSHLTPRSIDQFLSSRIGTSDGWGQRCSASSSLTSTSRPLSHLDQTGSCIIGVKCPSDAGEAQAADRVRKYAAFDMISPRCSFQDDIRSSAPAAAALNTTRSDRADQLLIPSLIGQQLVQPSMSSLQALLSKLPSVTPTSEPDQNGSCSSDHQASQLQLISDHHHCITSSASNGLTTIMKQQPHGMIDASSANNTPNASSSTATPAADQADDAAASESNLTNPILIQNFHTLVPDFAHLPDSNSLDNNESYNSIFLNEIY